MNPDWSAVAGRALAFLSLFQAAGTGLFLVLFTRDVPATHTRICRLGMLAAACGMVLVLVLPSLAAAQMAGDFGGLTDPSLLRLAWHSSAGAAHLVQLLGLALILAGLAAHPQRDAGAASWVVAVVLGAVLAAGALVLTGHTSVNRARALLAPLLMVHLLIVAFWFGALAPLWLALRHETLAHAAALLRRFSALAGWLVPLIALAGLGLAFVLIPSVAVLRRPYGLLLIGKLCVFLVLMGLAALNRWRLTPALETTSASRGALQRSIVAEYLLIAAVMAMTAMLTTLFSPED
ncbi:MAG TPA: CopD family protein [Steroidobacteraceae bacterium]